MKRNSIALKIFDNVSAKNFESLPKQQQIYIIIELLKIPPYMREQNDLELLAKSLMNVKFFHDLVNENDNDFDSLHAMCRKLTYKKFLKNETVFSINSVGKEFYIILNGRVSINVTTHQHNSITADSIYLTESYNKEKVPSLESNELHEVDEIADGGSFGELALLCEHDAVRQATIICKEDTDFAVLNKNDYKQTLAKIHARLIEAKIDFFSSLPIFVKESRRNMTTMIYYFHSINFTRNEYIYKEGDDANYMYVIKKGEIKLLKNIDYPKTENEQEIESRDIANNFKIHTNIQKSFELAILTIGEIFGEVDIFFHKQYKTSAICSSVNAEIYAISKTELLNRLKTSEHMMKSIHQFCQNKSQLREERLNKLQNTIRESKNLIWKTNPILTKSQNKPNIEDLLTNNNNQENINGKDDLEILTLLEKPDRSLSPHDKEKNDHHNIYDIFSSDNKANHINSPSKNEKKNVKFNNNSKINENTHNHESNLPRIKTPFQINQSSKITKLDFAVNGNNNRPHTSPIVDGRYASVDSKNNNNQRARSNHIIQIEDIIDKGIIIPNLDDKIKINSNKNIEISKLNLNKSMGMKDSKNQNIFFDNDKFKTESNEFSRNNTASTPNKRFTSRPEPICVNDLESTTIKIKAKTKLLSEIDKKPFELQFYKLGELPNQNKKKKSRLESADSDTKQELTACKKNFTINVIDVIKKRLIKQKNHNNSVIINHQNEPILSNSFISKRNNKDIKIKTASDFSPISTSDKLVLPNYCETDTKRYKNIKSPLAENNKSIEFSIEKNKQLAMSVDNVDLTRSKSPVKIMLEYTNETHIDDTNHPVIYDAFEIKKLLKSSQRKGLSIKINPKGSNHKIDHSQLGQLIRNSLIRTASPSSIRTKLKNANS